MESTASSVSASSFSEQEQGQYTSGPQRGQGAITDRHDRSDIAAPSRSYQDLSFEERTKRLQNLANRFRSRADVQAQGAASQQKQDEEEQQQQHQHTVKGNKVARRRRSRMREEHEQRRQRTREQILRRRELKWRRQLAKNDEIHEWRDTFEIGERPPGIEKQFLRTGVVPAYGEIWWLVPARTSKCLLERA